MTPTLTTGIRGLAVLVLIVGYYGVAAARVNGAAAALLLRRITLTRRLPRLQAEALLRAGVGGASQVLVLVVLAVVGGLTIGDLWPPDWHARYVLAGVLLGLGELGVSTFLIGVWTRLAVLLSSDVTRREEWFTLFRGGWMRAFLTTMRTAPWPLAVAMVTVYITVEETVFRGVVVGVTRSLGPAVALVISVALFAAAQLFNMPGWRNAVAAGIAATVIGLVHGSLYLLVPNLLPLVVAHLVLFLAAVL